MGNERVEGKAHSLGSAMELHTCCWGAGWSQTLLPAKSAVTAPAPSPERLLFVPNLTIVGASCCHSQRLFNSGAWGDWSRDQYPTSILPAALGPAARSHFTHACCQALHGSCRFPLACPDPTTHKGLESTAAVLGTPALIPCSLTLVRNEPVGSCALLGASQDLLQGPVEKLGLLQAVVPAEGSALVLRHGIERLQRRGELHRTVPGLRGRRRGLRPLASPGPAAWGGSERPGRDLAVPHPKFWGLESFGEAQPGGSFSWRSGPHGDAPCLRAMVPFWGLLC